MPFDFNTPLGGGKLGLSQFDKPEPSYLETVGAWVRQESPIGSYLSSARREVDDFDRIDPSYNPFEDIVGYEDYADRFERSYNPQATAAIKANIDKEQKDREIQESSGWIATGLGMGAALLTDPTILLPGGALVRAGRLGFRTGRSAVAVGAAAAVGTAAQETALQGTQETRTATETTLAIGGSAILGGLLGGAGAKLFTNAEWDRFSRALKEDLSADVPNPDEIVETIVSRAQSAGAAAVGDNIKLDDLGVGGPRIAQAVARATAAAKINPGIQTMLSPSKKVREVYAQLADNPIYTRMNMEGETLGAAVENEVKVYQRGILAQWLRGTKDIYREAKNEGWTGTRTEFNEAVARAGRRGDVAEDGNVFVTRAAQEARTKIFTPLLRKAQELGLLPDDIKVETAATYVTRFWNRQMLIGEEREFRRIAREYFTKEIAKLPADKKIDFVNDADLRDYVEEVVTSVFNNLTGKGAGDVPEWLVPVKRGPLKERTFKIPDEKIERFLENDMETILRRYTRIMGAEVGLAKKFGRADMRDQLDAIKKEYQSLREAAKTEAERMRLNADEKRDLTNLEAFRDMIRGTYRAAEEGSEWSKLTRAALAWNYMRLLGGVTITSLTDVSRFLGVYGLRATMREALPALASNVKAVKVARQDARDLGVVSETVLQTRLASLADMNDPYAYGSKYERYLSNATNLFTKATGLSWLNDTTKTIASVMTQNRILRNAMDWDKAGKREQAYMAYLGIDKATARDIAEQFRLHGVEENGIRGANLSEWGKELDSIDPATLSSKVVARDGGSTRTISEKSGSQILAESRAKVERARTAYAAALAKDVDRTIITKGISDTPLWMKSNWGRLLMQFKSFGLASHQRVLIAGLQERPHRLAEQLLIGTTIGMMIAYLKFIERGDTDEAERLTKNPGLWIADGLDRTGILSLPFEISNTAEKIGSPVGIKTAIQAAAGDEDRGGPVSRYASRNKLGAVAGPSAGIFQDLATIAEQLGDQGSEGKGLQKSGVNAIIRQIPGATLPGVRSALHLGVKPALTDAVD